MTARAQKEKSRSGERPLALRARRGDDRVMSQDLTGQLLIAMPEIGDPRFANAVIYLCTHSDDGAMGLIVNKPAPHIGFADLIEQIGITDPAPAPKGARIYFGGPVEMTRGFVLHSDDYHTEGATIDVEDGIALTNTLDVVQDILNGKGPNDYMLALGYAGWGAGQLEQEFTQNTWLTAPRRDDILFGRANEHKWTAALKSIGVNPLMLSSASGQA